MDPAITSPVPRKDSMGMDYVPVYAYEAEAVANQGAVVTIDPAVQQNENAQRTVGLRNVQFETPFRAAVLEFVGRGRKRQQHGRAGDRPTQRPPSTTFRVPPPDRPTSRR